MHALVRRLGGCILPKDPFLSMDKNTHGPGGNQGLMKLDHKVLEASSLLSGGELA